MRMILCKYASVVYGICRQVVNKIEVNGALRSLSN